MGSGTWEIECSGSFFKVAKQPVVMILSSVRLSDEVLRRMKAQLLEAASLASIAIDDLDCIESIVDEEPSGCVRKLADLQFLTQPIPGSGESFILGFKGPGAGDVDPAIRTQILRYSKALHKMRAEALLDPLTGLGNRRYFDLVFDRNLAVATRYRQDLALAILDIDGFKLCNDQYGHTEGDRILCRFANLLEGALRGADMLARYGGDEFMLLMPMTDRAGCVALLQRLRKTLGAEDSSAERGPSITFSAGASFFGDEEDGSDAACLINCADQRLLRAKQLGGNRFQID